MSLLEKARAQARAIATGTFSTPMSFKASTGEVAEVSGLDAVTHYNYDEGVSVNTQNGRITVSERELIAAGYPTRNAAGLCIMKGGTVSLADATGTTRTYAIEQAQPDNTLGMITMILGDTREVTT